MHRVFRAVHLHYRLVTPFGASAETTERRWVFEIPAARDTPAAWRELLDRIFADRTAALRRAEPDDPNGLGLDRFEVTAIEPTTLLEWSGARADLPWHTEVSVIAATCWWVDDDGRYDGMEADDFTELIALRLHAAGTIDDDRLTAHLEALYPGRGDRYFADRQARLANITCVRPTDAPRLAPDPRRAAPQLSPRAAPRPTRPDPPPPPADDEPNDDPPPDHSWILHPFTISLAIVLAIVGVTTFTTYRERWEREAKDRELAGPEAEWSALSERAKHRSAEVAAALSLNGPGDERGCAALSGKTTIVHRPMLDALAAGEVAPRRGPLWLNSDAWLYLASAMTPGRSVDQYARRNRVVEAALAAPCVGVLEADLAAPTRIADAHSFTGGEVVGHLRFVCPAHGGVVCALEIASAPLVAVSLAPRGKQRTVETGESAARDAAGRAFWRAAEQLLEAKTHGLRLDRDER